MQILNANSRNRYSIPDATAARRLRERRGRLAEFIAAGWMMLHGYRILARRQKTPAGEIDLIARRGNRVAFVEVKWRSNTDAAETAVTARQARRIARAAEYWLWRQPALRDCDFGLDAVYVVPWRLPRYAIDSLQPL